MLNTWTSQKFIENEFLHIAVSQEEFLFCFNYFNYCIGYFEVCEEDYYDVLLLVNLVRIQIIENRYLQQMLDIKLGKTFDHFLTNFPLGLQKLQTQRLAILETLNINKTYKKDKRSFPHFWDKLSLEEKKYLYCFNIMLTNKKDK